MSKTKVSVIIPIYNAERHLKKCLESVMSQTLRDIEIFCVDDGSTDSSWEIIEKYAADDSRIIAIKQENQGAAVARNKGLELAKGEYIGFVDSDDYVDDSYFEGLYTTAKAKGADIARAYVQAELEDGGAVPAGFRMEKLGDYEYQYNTYVKGLIEANKLNQRFVIWLSIFSRKMLQDNSIDFPPEIRTGQDVLFNIKTGYYCNKIVYVDKPVYYHRVMREGSLMSSYASTSEGLVSRSFVVKEAVKFLNTVPDYPEDIYTGHLSDALIFIFERLPHVDEDNAVLKIAKILSETWQVTKHKKDIHYRVAPSSAWFVTFLADEARLAEYIKKMSRSLGGPRVSVIIPVHNTEKYLQQCLDSVLNQTLGSIEVICVDDDSTDGSLDILKGYASRDKRVLVLEQRHGGAGAARNRGISKARGTYLYFLDSDDFIERGLLENISFEIDKYKADIAVFRAAELNVKTGRKREVEWVYIDKYVPEKRVFNYKDMHKYVFNTFGNVSWNKMFRRSFVVDNRLSYQEIFRTNDLYFTCTSLMLAKRIIAVEAAPLVTYRVGTESNSQATNDTDPLGFYEAFTSLRSFLIEHSVYDGDVRQSFLNHALDAVIYNLSSQKTYQGFKEVYETIRSSGDLLERRELSRDGYVYSQNTWALQDLRFIDEKSESEYLFARLQHYKELFEQELRHSQDTEEILSRERSLADEIKTNLDEVFSQLTDMRSSRSWRITKPLRFMAKPLKNSLMRSLHGFAMSTIGQVRDKDGHNKEDGNSHRR